MRLQVEKAAVLPSRAMIGGRRDGLRPGSLESDNFYVQSRLTFFRIYDQA